MLMNQKHMDLTHGIINAFYHVYNVLGFGFLERVYENALAYELRERGYLVVQQMMIKVNYKGWMVGDYFADLVVNDLIVVEVKAVQKIDKHHEVQVINYLKATTFDVGLLVNFGPKPVVKRKLYDFSRAIQKAKKELEK